MRITPTRYPRLQHTGQHHGLTLVESVVALLLIASITIGIATIYTQRQNIARGGHLHERAVGLANEMAASIRMNGDDKTNFETTLGATCTTSDKPRNKPGNKPGITKDTPVGNSRNIVACWQDSVEQELANGSANITLDRSSVPAQYIIVVSWSEPRSGTASYVLRVTPGGPGLPAAATPTPDGAVRAAG